MPPWAHDYRPDASQVSKFLAARRAPAKPADAACRAKLLMRLPVFASLRIRLSSLPPPSRAQVGPSSHRLCEMASSTLLNQRSKMTIVPPPRWPSFGRHRARVGRTRAKFGRSPAMVGRIWPISGQTWSSSGNVWPDARQAWPIPGDNWLTCADGFFKTTLGHGILGVREPRGHPPRRRRGTCTAERAARRAAS